MGSEMCIRDSSRTWNNSDTITAINVVGGHTQYQAGGTNNYFTVSSAHYGDLAEGMSIFNGTTYLGNIEKLYGNDRFYIDFYRPSSTLSAGNGLNITLKINNTIQNVVFKTERKYDNTIQNKGRDLMDAILVDNVLVDDEDDNSFDPLYWNKAFPLMKRSSTDSYDFSGNVWTESENLNGAMKYITFETASLKNDKIPTTLDTIVNNPKNKMSKMATVTTLDNSGTQHLKVTEDSKMIVRNGLFSDTMKLKKIEHTASNGKTALTANIVYIENMKSVFDYRSILATDTIIKIDNYYYIVSVINTAWDSNTNSQQFTSKAYKQENSNVWVISPTIQNFTDAELYVVHYSNNNL